MYCFNYEIESLDIGLNEFVVIRFKSRDKLIMEFCGESAIDVRRSIAGFRVFKEFLTRLFTFHAGKPSHKTG